MIKKNEHFPKGFAVVKTLNPGSDFQMVEASKTPLTSKYYKVDNEPDTVVVETPHYKSENPEQSESNGQSVSSGKSEASDELSWVEVVTNTTRKGTPLLFPKEEITNNQYFTSAEEPYSPNKTPSNQVDYQNIGVELTNVGRLEDKNPQESWEIC